MNYKIPYIYEYLHPPHQKAINQSKDIEFDKYFKSIFSGVESFPCIINYKTPSIYKYLHAPNLEIVS